MISRPKAAATCLVLLLLLLVLGAAPAQSGKMKAFYIRDEKGRGLTGSVYLWDPSMRPSERQIHQKTSKSEFVIKSIECGMYSWVRAKPNSREDYADNADIDCDDSIAEYIFELEIRNPKLDDGADPTERPHDELLAEIAMLQSVESNPFLLAEAIFVVHVQTQVIREPALQGGRRCGSSQRDFTWSLNTIIEGDIYFIDGNNRLSSARAKNRFAQPPYRLIQNWHSSPTKCGRWYKDDALKEREMALNAQSEYLEKLRSDLYALARKRAEDGSSFDELLAEFVRILRST